MRESLYIYEDYKYVVKFANTRIAWSEISENFGYFKWSLIITLELFYAFLQNF